MTVTGRGEVGYAKARMTHFTPVVRLLAVCSNHDCYFLENAINNHKVVVESTGVPQLTVPQLSSYNIFFPANGKEEVRIGKYFHTLDNLITLHQRECNQLKELKKTMLKKMFPRDGSNIPEVRFAGFTDDWEQRKLSEVLISLQNNTLSRVNLMSETGVAKNVHYGDVLIKFGDILDVSKEKLPMISDESILKKYKASFLQNGDVIVADTAEDSSVGKCSEIIGLNDEIVLSGLHTIPYRPVEKFASGYLGYYLNSSAYHNQLIPLMQGIKVMSISKSAMQNTYIIYPKLEEEQAKIGQYFSQLDNLITLHQREKRKDFRKKINIIVGYMNLVIIYKDYGKEENMATRGKSINLFLMDGEASGRIKCTLANWTGLAYKIPRIDLDRCKSREDLKQSGVYFLFGKSENSEKGIVYIGQAGARKNGEGILDRLKEHKRNSKKDYWTEAIVFTTSNNSFGPTEISYLENRFCNLAKQANRYEVKNENDPTMGNITEEKESEMEEFIDYAKVVMGTLGHKVFEPYAKSNVDNQNDISYDTDENNTILYLKRKVKEFGEVQATGMQTSDGFVVFSGSHISTEDDNTVPQVLKERKKTVKLDENGNLIDNMPFSSPSYAAMFVIGKSANGLVSWKDENGKTLKDLELNK